MNVCWKKNFPILSPRALLARPNQSSVSCARSFFLLGVLCALCANSFLDTSIAAAAPAPAPKWRVETADARVLSGQLQSISAEKIVVRTDKGPQELPIADVVEFSAGDQPDDIMDVPGQAVLQTAQGDALAVRAVSYDGKKLTASGGVAGRVETPADAARAILLPPVSRTAAEMLKAYEKMQLAPATGDRLIVSRAGAQNLAVDGVLEGIDADKIIFRWKDESRTIARASVPIIMLAAVASKPAAAAFGTLIARDSSRLRFRSLTLEAGKLVIDTAAMGRITMPLADAVIVRLSSSQVVRLSALKPVAENEHGFFETTFRHRVDKSVGGRPLRLGGRQYATGLGLHSFCELTYNLDANFTSFVAVVGIDDEARPHGDATVTFQADGKPLGEGLHVTGQADPQPVRLDVRGVKQLMIRVGFGPDGLGVGDHVDLAGARLIK